MTTEYYLLALPKAESEFLQQIRESQHVGTVGERRNQLVDLLVQRPYPTLQIIRCALGSAQTYPDVIRAIHTALEKLLTDCGDEQPISLSLISFLANFPLALLEGQGLRDKLTCVLKAQLAWKHNDEIHLALLGRIESEPVLDVIAQLTSGEAEPWWQRSALPSKVYALAEAMHQKRHFVSTICEQLRYSMAPRIADAGLRNNLLVLKVANEFRHTASTLNVLADFAKGLAHFDPDESPPELQEMHRYFYADFQRLSLIVSFLRKYPEGLQSIRVGALLQANSILGLLLNHNIQTSYEETRAIVESVYQWQQRMNTGAKSVHNQELETLVYYTALGIVLDVVLADTALTHPEYYAEKMQQLNGLLRQVRNLDMLCSLLEDTFQLVFLRWEHVRVDYDTTDGSSNGLPRSTTGSGSSNPAASSDRPTRQRLGAHGARHGFVCRGVALYNIFTQLRQLVQRRCHSEDYKHASERLQLRFQRIVDVISEALWKYAVLEKIDDALSRTGACQHLRQHRLSPDDLLQLVQLHADTAEKSSSDDDSRDRTRCNYLSLTRRKVAPKKRRRATISGALGTAADGVQVAATTAGRSVPDDEAAPPKVRDMAVRFADRSIIPKMLGSPQDLAIMALALNNLEDVKYIIKTFNLQNSELERELSFVEQQQLVKQKLSTIYANYEREERSGAGDGQHPKATVEQIKQVAAKGFEVSKLISVVDNFAKAQRVQQTPEVQRLLQRFTAHAQYGCLRQFDARNLNAVIVCDLVLTLPLNRDITCSLLAVIRRQQQQLAGGIVPVGQPHCGDNVTARRTQQLPRDIGSIQLLENLSECLRLLHPATLPQLLCDNYYALKPRHLAVELQRQRAFEAIFNKPSAELASVEQLRSQTPLFQRLQSQCNYYMRFHAYVAQLAKLAAMREAREAPRLHIGQLLQIDAYTLISELLFDADGMTPVALEAHVCALNLNLLHVLALTLGPEIATERALHAPRRATLANREKQQTIVNYVGQQNRLLAHLLQNIVCNGDSSTPTATTSAAAATGGAGGSLNSAYLRNILRLPFVERLAALHGGNKFCAVLLSDSFSLARLQQCLPAQPLKQLELLQQELGNRSAATVAAERCAIDRLISELIASDGKYVYLAGRMGDVAMRARLIHAHFTKIATTRLAKQLIEHTLHDRGAAGAIPGELRAQLEATLADITVYAHVSEVLQFETWPQAYDFGLKTPNTIFQRLLQLRLYKLCYEWCRVVRLAERFAAQRCLFLDVLAGALLKLSDETASSNASATPPDDVHAYLLRILQTFPLEDCVTFLDVHKDRFRSLPLLTYAIDFLAEHNNSSANNNRNMYANYKVSLAIFRQLTHGERAACWQLLRYPLLLVEQTIMNAKFELLAKVLGAVRGVLGARSQPEPLCPYCFDKRGGNIYNIHAPKAATIPATATAPTGAAASPRPPQHFQLGGGEAARVSGSAFILLNFNLYQQNHLITNECVDLLLRIYATKALDYHIAEGQASWEQISQTTTTDMQQSLDSLCDVYFFQMPHVAPSRGEWVRDDEATHCMCCRRAKFTMLMRRHHCRRCGRVVCYACSTHRLRIPEFYADLEVRICNDCQRNTTEATAAASVDPSTARDSDGVERLRSEFDGNGATPTPMPLRWKLSGNITHDKLVREEFCYEHAPSVALCLAILAYHVGQAKCVDLLLYHCHQLEKLIVPSPEVDYALVAKMMNCLAVAAKVRGGPAEIETIHLHCDIIIAVVQHGCDALINYSPRKLADSLVQAEKWQLALEVSLKCGFPTAGVMAAHGLSCLRAGCFDTAREKFSHCMPKLSSELTNSQLLPCLIAPHAAATQPPLPQVKRPQRGPPLLQEILKLIEATMSNAPPQEETLKRASLIRSSNSSLASLLARHPHPKEQRLAPPLHEPALNILNTLANLKRIAKGQYDRPAPPPSAAAGSPLAAPRRDFDECMHYLLTYGAHADILRFLVQRQLLPAALQYVRIQSLDADLFIRHVFTEALRCGRLPQLIDCMAKFDPSLASWCHLLIPTCRHLETQQLLNALYQLQLLLKDPVRASMTCVKFYSLRCESFQQMHANAEHLRNAHYHLQSELEIAQWENIGLETNDGAASVRNKRNSSMGGSRRSSLTPPSFLMQLNARSLNSHISTILRQLEVAKFLAQCERTNCGGSEADGTLATLRILKQIRLEPAGGKWSLPTLFDTPQDKIQICILLLLCGKNIEEGYGLAYRIIDAYKLPPMKVFAATAKYLARNRRLGEVEKLLSCISSSNNNAGGSDTRDMDELLSIAINSADNNHETEVKNMLDSLTKRIQSVELRISSHIYIGQLKSAYLLANKYERLGDIRRILRQAELANQTHIKKLCEKKLSMSTSASASERAGKGN